MKFKISTFLLVLSSLLATMSVFAQQTNTVNRTVVVYGNSEAVIGASVTVKGTTIGAYTDINGEAQIKCADDALLVVSYLGFQDQEVAVSKRTKIEVILKDDAQRIDEVVVVGYNTIRRAQTTGALSKVSEKDLQFQSSPTLENRLQGQTPGVMVSMGSGQPGSNDLSIRVRGSGSINGSNTPLYIMDGVMVEAADFAALNSNDIADIQILKDASATAIYGSRGANGVIVITTKSGSRGTTTVNYRNQFSFSYLVDYIDMMNSAENLQYQLQCVQSEPGSNFYPMMQILKRAQNGTASEEDLARLAKAQATDTDWMDLMTQTGFSHDHNISVSGGNDKTRFFVSGSYLSQQGILKKSALERYSVRFNIDHKISHVFEMGLKATTGYSTMDFADPDRGSGRQHWSNPWFTTLLAYPYEDPDNWNNADNPTLITKYLQRKTGRLKTVASTYLKANITDWLTLKSNFGVDFMYSRNTNTLHRNHPTAQLNKGHYESSNSELFRYTWTNTASVNKTWNDVHTLNAVVGMEMFQGKWFNSRLKGYDMNADMMDSPAGVGDKNGSSKFPPSIGGGRTKSNLLSYFMQASYSYDNRYNLSASLRYDTSSKFYSKNASATFWSLGASWLMSSEKWMQRAEWLNMLKLRLSYGTTGNQDGVSDFGTFDGYFNSSYNGESGYGHGQLGNSELHWETSAQTNFGIDFAVLDSRINLSLDLYNIKTEDLYMSKNISMTSGFKSILTNAGSIVNRGIEVSLQLVPVKTKNFQWDLGFNFTYNKNKIDDLGTWANESGRYKDGNTLYEVGRPLGTWIMPYWAGVSPANGMPMFYDKYGDLTTDIKEALLSDHYGSFEIPMFGGFNTTLRYKGVSLSAQFTYAIDNTVMNCQRWYMDNHKFNGNKPKYMLNMWMKQGDVTDVPAFRDGIQPSPMASQFLEDATYVRLKTLRLTWDMPKSWMKRSGFLRNVSLYIQGENLVTWTDYRGADPEVNGGYDFMSYPKPRTLSFGVDMTF